MAEHDLQVAVKAAIDAIMPISGVGTVEVYDHVPQDTDQPFIKIGENTTSGDDTKTDLGVVHEVEVNVYSSYRGLKEVKLMIDAIREALNLAALTVSGYSSTQLRYVSSITFEEPDGTRGVIRFRTTTYA